MLHATIQEGVEDHSVSAETTVHHLLEDLQCGGKVSTHTMSTDHTRVCDGVGLATLLVHLLHQLLGSLHQAVLGVGVDQGCEHDVVRLHTVCPHVLEQRHRPVRITYTGEALNERRIDDGVASHLRLPISEQSHCVLNPLSLYQGIDHATKRDVIRDDPAAVDHLIPEIPASLGPSQDGTTLDQQTIRPHARPHLAAGISIDSPRKMLVISTVDASIHHCIENNLVLKDEHIWAVQNAESLVSVAHIWKLP
mmetsp:Transcript_57875/g.146808  ORF Transcript_57875/g.146808 Transcript_57875/m.146808 type:complete len:251 (+) Transcript_57875:796-1548(+)